VEQQIGTRRTFSEAVQEEMFAKYTEMLYLQEFYPEAYEKRMAEFQEEIERDARFRELNPVYPEKTNDPHGPDPHPSASKLFFSIEANPELKEFVESLYATKAHS